MPFDFDALSTDPMFQMGIGIMGSNSPNFATAVGRGMQSGMMNVTEQRVERQNALFRQMQVAQYQAQVAAAQRAQVAAEQQRQQQEAAQQAYRGTIPQGQQALFDVAPGAYAGEAIKSRFDQQQQGPYKGLKEQFGVEDTMRKDFWKYSDAYREASNWNSVIQGAGSTGANDYALIQGLNKMLDPASTVREAESAEAASVAGELNTIRNMFASLTEGSKLPDEAREQIKNLSNRLFRIRENDYIQLRQGVKDRAGQYQIDPGNIFAGSFEPPKGGTPPRVPPKQLVLGSDGKPITKPPVNAIPLDDDWKWPWE